MLFIIFGTSSNVPVVANFFISFANRLAGWSSGGPAKVAVISSALCGMVSGSSVGNTVTTGSVTIPMMKKTGYRPEFAGAVEACIPLRLARMAHHHGRLLRSPPLNLWASLHSIRRSPSSPTPICIFGGIFCTVHLEAKGPRPKGEPLQRTSHLIYHLLKELLSPIILLKLF